MSTPSTSNTANQEMLRRQNKGPPFKFLVPLIYAPALPLIRLTLRHRPVLRDRLFTAVLAGAFAHGMYLVILHINSGAVYGLLIILLPFKALISHGHMYMVSVTSPTRVQSADIMVSDIYDAESK